MKAVVKLKWPVASDAFEEERIERHAELLRELGIDRIEEALVVQAVVGRGDHAGERGAREFGRVPASFGEREIKIETLRAQAEVEPVKSLAAELSVLHKGGADVLGAYLRNVRLALYDKAQQIYMEAGK